MAFIALAPAGTVDGEALALARACAVAAIGLPAERTASLPDPAYAYDQGRKQYSSTLIMRDAVARVPAGAAKLLVLTECDIFIPMLSFVFGQAQLDGAVAVLSLARLRQEFHGLPPNRALFLVRVAKEALHELGHTFGLTHCTDRGCAMSLATNLRQLDSKGRDFCSSCEILLRDAVERIQSAAADLAGRST